MSGHIGPVASLTQPNRTYLPPRLHHHHQYPQYLRPDCQLLRQSHPHGFRPMAFPCASQTCLHLPPHDQSAHDDVIATTGSLGSGYASTLPSTVSNVYAQYSVLPFPEDSYSFLSGDGPTIEQAGVTHPFRPVSADTVEGTTSGSTSHAFGDHISSSSSSSSNNNNIITNTNGSSPDIYLNSNPSAATAALAPLDTSFNSSAHPGVAMSPITQFPTLCHSVDSSQYTPVSNADWLILDTASVSSADSRSNGPNTPHSQLSDHDYPQLTHDDAPESGHNGISKFESDAQLSGSFSSTSSFSSSSSSSSFYDFQQQLSTPAPFGGIAPPGTIGPAAMWPTMSANAVYGSGVGHCNVFAMSGSCLPLPQVNQTPYQPMADAQPYANMQPIFDPSPRLEDLETDSSEGSPEASESESERGSDTASNTNDRAVTTACIRRDRDNFLIQMRKKNISYKEIKRLGKFKEAESTLRGRVRSLTKPKDQRVRSPEWTDGDVALLENAFVRFAAQAASTRPPWKKISDWMGKHGASYAFAPATCAKKWKEMH